MKESNLVQFNAGSRWHVWLSAKRIAHILNKYEVGPGLSILYEKYGRSWHSIMQNRQ